MRLDEHSGTIATRDRAVDEIPEGPAAAAAPTLVDHEEGDARPTGRPVRRRWTVEVALVAVLYVVYDASRGLRHGSLRVAYANGMRVLHLEQRLHIDPEHALNDLLWHDKFLAVISSYDYATLHFVVTPLVLIWMYRRHPDAYGPARTAIAVATVSALLVFWLLPTAPPRLLPGDPFHDILASVHQWGWWSSEGSAPRGLGGLTNQLAAMPSLHVGWALWSGWLVARYARRRAVRVLGALYPLTTALVVMGTGNHYLLDTLAGVSIVAVGAAVAGLAYGRVAPHRHEARTRPAGTVAAGGTFGAFSASGASGCSGSSGFLGAQALRPCRPLRLSAPHPPSARCAGARPRRAAPEYGSQP